MIKQSIGMSAVLVAAALFVASNEACAQDAPAKAPAGVEVREKVITRVYDIADIIYGMRNYPFSSAILPPALTEDRKGSRGGSGGGGGSLFGSASMPETEDTGAARRAEAVNQLMALLIQTIAIDSWADNGGTVGTIRPLGGKLIITQTEASHERISQLLKELKGTATTARTVTVSAHWLLLTQQQADGLVAKDANGRATQRLNADALRKLPEGAAVHRGTLRCLNGQTVHLQSGTGRTTVVELTPIVGNEIAALDPGLKLLHAGLSFQVTPQVDADGKTALVDVHSIYSDRRPDGEPISVQHAAMVRGSTTRPVSSADANGPMTSARIDRLEVVSQQLQTSLRLRTGEPTLVGGMTLDPTEKGDDRQLYLVLDVSAETVAP